MTLILFIEWGNREKVPDGRTSEQSPTAQPCLLGRTGTEARIKGIESRVRRGCIITRVEVKGVRGETRVSPAPLWGSVQSPSSVWLVASLVLRIGTREAAGCHISSGTGVLVPRGLSHPLSLHPSWIPSVDPNGCRPKRLCPKFLPDGMHCQQEHGSPWVTHSTGSPESLMFLWKTMSQ